MCEMTKNLMKSKKFRDHLNIERQKLKNELDYYGDAKEFKHIMDMMQEFLTSVGIDSSVTKHSDTSYGGPVVNAVIKHPIFNDYLGNCCIMIRYIPRRGWKFTHIYGLNKNNYLSTTFLPRQCTYVTTDTPDWREKFMVEYDKMMELLKKYYIQQQNNLLEQDLDVLAG